MAENYDEDQRTVWCGNLSDKVTEEILYELFLQAAPLERVRIPKDKDGKQSSYGFVTFKHLVSVQYAIDLLNSSSLFDRRINIKPRSNNFQRQNSHQNDYLVTGMQKHSNQQINNLDVFQSLNMLMQMGDNLLINNKVHSNHNNFNQNNMHSSSPYRRPENKNYYDDRHEDNRSNYRKHHHRNNDRRNSNHRLYYGSRRFDR